MYRRILVAYNGSARATRALVAALRLARDWGADLQVLCVAELPGAQPLDAPWALAVERRYWMVLAEGWRQQVHGLGRAHGVCLRAAVLAGEPAQVIAVYAAQQERDLLVLGGHAWRCGGWWNADRAARIARRAPCAVLIVR